MHYILLAAILLQSTATHDNSTLTAQKAVEQYKAQNLEKAIQTFLVSLEGIQSNIVAPEEDEKLYREALTKYLEHGASSAQQSAFEILEQYQPILEKNPDFHLLEFLVAASYANLGKFDLFFDHFYTAYKHHPNHYFAYKTKAILHIKLMERARTQKERDEQRAFILQNVNWAAERYPKDHSLYKLMIHFSNPEHLHETTGLVLKKIIDNNIVVPRSEIVYYVRKGIEGKQSELAKRFVEKTQEWYKYSRAIETAENLLKQEKKSLNKQ